MRHGLCAIALCALAAPALGRAPLPHAATGAPARPSSQAAPELALAQPPAATPTRETGGVTAPLPRGNPGDPSAREERESIAADARSSIGAERQASDTEAKGCPAAPGESRGRDTEGK